MNHERPINEGNLPEFPPRPYITLYPEQLEKFRDDYTRLAEFMAFVVGKPLESCAPIDVGAWVLANDHGTGLPGPVITRPFYRLYEVEG